MTLKAKCPCGHVFTFDTDKVSFRERVAEDSGNQSSDVLKYLPKCPKCSAQVEVPNPNKKP